MLKKIFVLSTFFAVSAYAQNCIMNISDSSDTIRTIDTCAKYSISTKNEVLSNPLRSASMKDRLDQLELDMTTANGNINSLNRRVEVGSVQEGHSCSEVGKIGADALTGVLLTCKF